VWVESQWKEFEALKYLLFSTLVLSLPDLQQPFEIEIDALDYVVGAILTQHGHPMAYHSETLSDAIQKYATYYKEMYCILQAYQKWKHYILKKGKINHIVTSLCSSYKCRENYIMTTIKSGPHICNSSTSTSNTIKVAPIGSLTTSIDLQSQH
jgi:hypothetical protein